MKFEDAATQINPEIYQRFKAALELGKWPDGRKLTREQKEICLQAIMIYEAKHQMVDGDRIGYVDTAKKASSCGTDKPDDTQVDTDNGIESIRILH